MENPLKNPK